VVSNVNLKYTISRDTMAMEKSSRAAKLKYMNAGEILTQDNRMNQHNWPYPKLTRDAVRSPTACRKMVPSMTSEMHPVSIPRGSNMMEARENPVMMFR